MLLFVVIVVFVAALFLFIWKCNHTFQNMHLCHVYVLAFQRSLCMYVYMYICMYVCMYCVIIACMYWLLSDSCVCVYVCMYICMYASCYYCVHDVLGC